MKSALLLLLVLSAAAVTARPLPVSTPTTLSSHEGWPVTITGQDDIWLGTLPAVPFNDNIIVARTGIPNSSLLIFSAQGQALQNISVSCMFEPQSSPSIGDVLIDAGEELVLPCRAGHTAYIALMNSTGTVQLIPAPQLADTDTSAIVLVDTNEDGFADLLYGGQNSTGRQFVIMDGTGTTLDEFPLHLEQEINMPVVDVRARRIIIVSWGGSGSSVSAVSYNGTVLWQTNRSELLLGSPIIVRRGMRSTVAVSTERGLLFFDDEGRVVRTSELGSFAQSAPLAADNRHIIIGYGTDLYAIGVRTTHLLHTDHTISSTLLVDIDGDGEQDIIAVAGPYVYGLHKDGIVVLGFPLSLPYPGTQASIIDVDDNEAHELIVSAALSGEQSYGSISMWDVRSRHAAWPMLQQNLQRTGGQRRQNI